MKNIIKTILYARVSSREQEETGYSLDAQEKLLKDYAVKNCYETAKIFRITESASGRQIRKTFNEMFEYANKHKISVILCEKIDRLTRNIKDAAIVSDWITENEARQVHFVKENFILSKNTRAHENLVWDMKVAIARFYTNNLSEEVKKGQKEKLAQGWLPTKPPLGYKTIGDKGHKTHIIDEEKAPMVKKFFELYSSGNYSINELVKMMSREGLRNAGGGVVGRSRMHEMLSDPFYFGKIRWKGEIYQGEQKPLISKELFDEVQRRLNRNTASPQYKKHYPVFKAKISCEECGATITWEIQKGHWYGHHSTYEKYKNCTKKFYIRQEAVEKQLFPYFDKVAPKNERVLRVLEKALKESHADEINYYQAKRQALDVQHARIQKRLEAIYEDKIDGKITADFYERKFKEYSEEKESILNQLSKLSDTNAQYYEAGFAIHELALKARDIYQSEKADVDERRLLLSHVFSNLTLNGSELRVNYTLAFEFLAEWMPRINKVFEPSKNRINMEKNAVFATQYISKLAWQDGFRTFGWANALSCPKIAVAQINQLLALV